MGSEFRLRDMCLKIGSGATPKGGKENYKSSGISLIRSQNIYNGEFSESGLAYIDDEQANLLSNVEVIKNDILINITGDSVARCCMAPEEYLPARVNQHVCIIRTDSRLLDPQFLMYYLISSSMQDLLLTLSSAGATRNALTKGMIEDLRIPSISIELQRYISRVLGDIDLKIRINRKMNHTLEAMARALFKSWFVDFDPVKANAEGRRMEGISPEVQALFPSEFDDSPLGPVPLGWKYSKIGSEISIAGGSTPSTQENKFWEGGNIHWTTPKDLSSLTFPILLDTERKITEAGLKVISSGLLPEGTLLMSSRAPVGYLAISKIPVAINQGYIAMNFSKAVSNYYMLNWCKLNMDTIIGIANGTTFLEVSKSNFKTLDILIPSKEIIRVYDRLVGSLYEKIAANEKENKLLAKTRDTLLPKLLSGELDVSQLSNLVSTD